MNDNNNGISKNVINNNNIIVNKEYQQIFEYNPKNAAI